MTTCCRIFNPARSRSQSCDLTQFFFLTLFFPLPPSALFLSLPLSLFLPQPVIAALFFLFFPPLLLFFLPFFSSLFFLFLLSAPSRPLVGVSISFPSSQPIQGLNLLPPTSTRSTTLLPVCTSRLGENWLLLYQVLQNQRHRLAAAYRLRTHEQSCFYNIGHSSDLPSNRYLIGPIFFISFFFFLFQQFFNLYNLVDLTTKHIFPAGPLIRNASICRNHQDFVSDLNTFCYFSLLK